MPEVGPVVTLEDVTVRYGKQAALRGVTTTFEPGAVGLLGPNGAGKSTMIKALLGFLVPERGRMRVLGLDVAEAPLDIRARVGYMPESDAHIPGMNAVSFVAYCGELAGLPRVDAMQRAHEVLFYVGLGEARYRNVETYSTGMKQRIKLAQALVHDPDLLFLDEPTNGMDPKGRDEMLELVRDLAHNKGVNLILSSHLLPDVEYTCDPACLRSKMSSRTPSGKNSNWQRLKSQRSSSMPIHDQGYRRYGGDKTRGGTGWIVITRAGIRTFFAKRAFLGLLLVSWFPFFVRAVQIYAATNLPQAAFLAPTPETFRQFLDQQQIFVFFVTVYVGSGLIANDRRANALQIYLSKPLTRAEYVFGKLAILMTFLALVTWLPAIVLLVVQVAFTGSFAFLRANIFLVPAITIYSFLEITMVATTMLALSSLSNSSRYVAILYTVVLFFTQAIYGVLTAVTRSTSFSWVSYFGNLSQIAAVIFRQPLKYATPWP